MIILRHQDAKNITITILKNYITKSKFSERTTLPNKNSILTLYSTTINKTYMHYINFTKEEHREKIYQIVNIREKKNLINCARILK